MRYPLLALAFASSLAACGSSDSQPLLSGSVAGTYDTSAFTIKNGVQGKANGVDVVALSSDDFGCSTLSAPNPPSGHFADIVVTSFDAGSYPNSTVQMFENSGSLSFVSSSTGTLEISAVTTDKLTATLTYSDTLSGKSYALNGTFEVTRCQ